MSPFPLCVITARVPRLGRDHQQVAQAALVGGAPMVQLRDKELSTVDFLEVAEQMRKLTRDHGATLIINDRWTVAFLVEADGVHLGPEDKPVATVRHLLGPEAVIGASVASVEEAQAAEAAGASYVSVGAIYATPSKADAGEPIGLQPIGDIKRAVTLPVLAIGGITCDNVEAVIRAGADGVAVISAVAEAEDMVGATRALLARIRQSAEQRSA